MGGIADWFAVTALFRRPLGLPIPHTAIIPTQKERIGRVLGKFVQDHFLSRAVLADRLAALQPAERTGRWLRDPEHARVVARKVAIGLARAVELLPEAEVKELVHQSAVGRLERVPLAPLLGDVLAIVAAGNRHQELLNEAVRLVASTVEGGRDTIRARVRRESPRWLPGTVTDAVADRIVAGVQGYLAEVRADPRHPMRDRFDEALRDFIERLKTSPEVIARAEVLKRDLLGHPLVDGLASALWEQARRAAARYRESPESSSLEPLEAAMVGLGESLLENAPLREEVNRFVADVVASVVEQHREEVAGLIAATVRDWDPELASRRLELAVGRDLQFIRLNGTLVGGLAGLVLYTLTRLF